MIEESINPSPDTLHNTGTVQADSGTVQHIRALAMPFLKGQMTTEADGSLLIRDVPMLAEGNWTDSAVQTPLIYPAKVLEAYAGNWMDTSGWSRHLGGVPRDSTDKVAEAVNPHYGSFTGKDGLTHNAVLSDIRVHPFTQKSRDMQEMIRHSLISFVSVEHGGKEELNPTTRQMEAVSLTFTGFAFVNKGACKLCRLNETPQSPKKEQEMTEKELETIRADLIKEMDARFVEFKKELAAKAEPKIEVKEPVAIAEVPKELSEVDVLKGTHAKELEVKNAEIQKLSEQVKALESQGIPKTTLGEPKEIGYVERVVSFDKKNRTVRGA